VKRGFACWAALAAWCLALALAQSALAAPARLGAWAPELVLVVLVALSAEARARDVLPLALCAALARIACSVEPAAAVLAGMLALAGALHLLRGVVELRDPLARAALALVAALALELWLALVQRARGAEGALAALAWPAALATAACALACAPLVVRLPGLAPLRRHAW
jgi:hypothetical protein